MRALKALVIGMAVLIVIVATVVAVEIAGRLGAADGNDAAADQAPLDADAVPRALPVPAGWDIADMTADGDTLVLRLTNAAGDQEIMVVDLASGAVVRRLKVVPE